MRSTEKAALRFQPTKATRANGEEGGGGEKKQFMVWNNFFPPKRLPNIARDKKGRKGEKKVAFKGNRSGLSSAWTSRGGRGKSPKNVPLLPVCMYVCAWKP